MKRQLARPASIAPAATLLLLAAALSFGDPGDGQRITVKINAPGFEGAVEAEPVGQGA